MKTILAIVALTAGGTAWAVNPAPVTVANPSLNVNVTNTPLPVSVTNATTNQSVTVTNSASNPIPVTVTPAEEPFQVGTGLQSFSTGLGSTALVSAPAGKRLVIEHVSAVIDATGPNGLIDVNVNVGKTNDTDSVVCRPTGATADGTHHYFSCSTVTTYSVGPGVTMNFTVQVVDNGGATYRAFVSGHYVPSP